VHPIDESSPLLNFDKKSLDNSKAEFMVLLKGFNNTLSQGVHSRTSYKFYDVEWNAKFAPIFRNQSGNALVAIDKISEYEKIT
jgi:inward rectifier potassium channel